VSGTTVTEYDPAETIYALQITSSVPFRGLIVSTFVGDPGTDFAAVKAGTLTTVAGATNVQ
jgi:hypothetical protein